MTLPISAKIEPKEPSTSEQVHTSSKTASHLPENASHPKPLPTSTKTSRASSTSADLNLSSDTPEGVEYHSKPTNRKETYATQSSPAEQSPAQSHHAYFPASSPGPQVNLRLEPISHKAVFSFVNNICIVYTHQEVDAFQTNLFSTYETKSLGEMERLSGIWITRNQSSPKDIVKLTETATPQDVLYCQQNVKLLPEHLASKNSSKIFTKSRHIDIHRHWFRPKIREQMPLAQAPADRLIRKTPIHRHNDFAWLLGLVKKS